MNEIIIGAGGIDSALRDTHRPKFAQGATPRVKSEPLGPSPYFFRFRPRAACREWPVRGSETGKLSQTSIGAHRRFEDSIACKTRPSARRLGRLGFVMGNALVTHSTRSVNSGHTVSTSALGSLPKESCFTRQLFTRADW